LRGRGHYPTEKHYKKILDYYVQKYGLSSSRVDVSAGELKSRRFTAAEIANLVEKAYMLDEKLSTVLSEKWVIPLSEAEPEKIRYYISLDDTPR
jgi:hypothetical protein